MINDTFSNLSTFNIKRYLMNILIHKTFNIYFLKTIGMAFKLHFLII